MNFEFTTTSSFEVKAVSPPSRRAATEWERPVTATQGYRSTHPQTYNQHPSVVRSTKWDRGKKGLRGKVKSDQTVKQNLCSRLSMIGWQALGIKLKWVTNPGQKIPMRTPSLRF